MAHAGDGAHDGHDGGHAHGGHATVEALVIAAIGTHGDSHVSLAYHVGQDSHDQSHGGAKSISPQGGSALCGQVPTTAENGEAIRGFRCDFSRHGSLDILTNIARLAKKCDLISLNGLRPGLDCSHSFFPSILDRDAFGHAQELSADSPYGAVSHRVREKPKGWYPGATGYTCLYSGYWQVGKRKHMFGAPGFDDQAGTYIKVSVITWSFLESGDFETTFEVRIISMPEWSPSAQDWGYRRKSFESHQRAAIKVYTAVMQLLRATKPCPAALFLRGVLDAKFPPQAEVPEGNGAMTEAEILEREMEEIAEDALDDQVARDNQPGLPAASDGDGATTADLTFELDD